MSYVIGVDVGGTNTDVAILQGCHVIGWNKSLTTSNIITGVTQSIHLAVKNAHENGYKEIIGNIQRVNIGTTQFINAVINRRGLERVSCIRLCGITSHSLPPFCDFPEDLRGQIDGGYYLLNGGFEFNSDVITEIKEEEICEALKDIVCKGVNHIAVSGIFSPTNPSQEETVQKLISKHYPNLTYTLSSKLGRLGLLERENAAILNESLKALCKKAIAGFKDSLEAMGVLCPVYFTQNDGTLLSEVETLKYPVHTFSSGATNSMRGAAYLSSVKDAVIVDIGGTTTDVGVLMNGFLRESSTRVKVGGVNINFRMPDTTSIGLGGGSVVSIHNDKVSVGPSSVEYRIKEEAFIFGGTTMVASDFAVAKGLADFGNKENVLHFSVDFVDQVILDIKKQLEVAIDAVKLSDDHCSLILVGGGSVLIDPKSEFSGVSTVKRPDFYQVANAVGAAISQVSGTFDELCLISPSTRDEVLEKAKSIAIDKAVENGGIRNTCRIVDISELQMSYMAVPYARVCVKAVGELENYGKNVGEGNECLKNAESAVFEENVEGIDPKSDIEKDVTNIQLRRNDDESTYTHTPEVNEKGEWVLNMWDVDCLAIGAGILGCGGGGSTYLGRLKLMRCLKDGKRPRIIHPDRMSEDEVAYTVGYMGAPEICTERIDDVDILKNSLMLCNELMMLGFKGEMSKDEVTALALSHELICENIDEDTVIFQLSAGED